MTLEALGQLGSFIGGVFGAFALLYLAFQVRQNTTALRMTAYQESLRTANAFSELLALHPDLARLFLRARADVDALDAEERVRVSQILLISLRNYAFNLELAEKALIPPGICDAYEVGLRPFLDTPGGRAWWAENAAGFHTKFRTHFEARLAEWQRTPVA